MAKQSDSSPRITPFPSGIGRTGGADSSAKTLHFLRDPAVQQQLQKLSDDFTKAVFDNKAVRAVILTLPVIAVLLMPKIASATIGGSSTSFSGSLTSSNNDLLNFLENDFSTLCMIIGGILAWGSHTFNEGRGLKVFLSIFGGGVAMMGFNVILSLAHGMANSIGH